MADNNALNTVSTNLPGATGYTTENRIEQKDSVVYIEEIVEIIKETFMMRQDEKKQLGNKIEMLENLILQAGENYKNFLITYKMASITTPIEALIPNITSIGFGEDSPVRGVDVVDSKNVIRPNPTIPIVLQTTEESIKLLGDVDSKLKSYRSELYRLQSLKKQLLKRLDDLVYRLPMDIKSEGENPIIEELMIVYEELFVLEGAIGDLIEIYSGYSKKEDVSEKSLDDSQKQFFNDMSYLYTMKLKNLKTYTDALISDKSSMIIKYSKDLTFDINKFKTFLDTLPNKLDRTAYNTSLYNVLKSYRDGENGTIVNKSHVIALIKKAAELSETSDQRVSYLVNDARCMFDEIRKSPSNDLVNTEETPVTARQVADVKYQKKEENIKNTKEILKILSNPNLSEKDVIAMYEKLAKSGLKPVFDKITNLKKTITKGMSSGVITIKESVREKVRNKYGGDIPFEDEIDTDGTPIKIEKNGELVFAKKADVVKVGKNSDGTTKYALKQNTMTEKVKVSRPPPNLGAY